jgi:hypothetical protein
VDYENYGRMSHDQHLWEKFLKNPSRTSNLRVTDCSRRRVMISLQKGYMGLTPGTARVGDLIGIFLGGTVPHVLRPNDDGTYSFLRECYVHGLMDGEDMKMLEEGEAKVEELTLS